MIMYYFYERIWASISWGKINRDEKDTSAMSFRDKVMWVSAIVVAVVILFILIMFVWPMIKKV